MCGDAMKGARRTHTHNLLPISYTTENNMRKTRETTSRAMERQWVFGSAAEQITFYKEISNGNTTTHIHTSLASHSRLRLYAHEFHNENHHFFGM